MCSVVTVIEPVIGPVRVMTTHLEFYSKPQRIAQSRALRELHEQYTAHALAPPEPSDDGSPFQTQVHTANAVLCGDFNLEAVEPEYAVLTGGEGEARLWDAWGARYGAEPQPPTFRLHDRRYGPVPICCDFVFVSGSLKGRVRRLAIDGDTQVSDHQPVLVEFN